MSITHACSRGMVQGMKGEGMCLRLTELSHGCDL